MRVFLQELRKIFRPVPVLLLTGVVAIYSLVLFALPYSWLTEAHNTSDSMAVARDLIPLCGLTVEPGELPPAAETLRLRYWADLEAAITADPGCAAIGVTDAESYCVLKWKKLHLDFSGEDMTDEERSELFQAWAGWYYEELRDTLEAITDYSLTPEQISFLAMNFLDDCTKGAANRLTVLYEAYNEFRLEEAESIAAAIDSWETPQYLNAHVKRLIAEQAAHASVWTYTLDIRAALVAQLLAVLIVLSLAVLLAPVLTKDNMQNLRQLQYASKTGRRTLRAQLWAMLAAAGLVAGIEIAGALGFFSRFVWREFLPVKMNSAFALGTYYWYTGTFRGWLWAVAGMLLLSALFAACVIFLLSKAGKNYISLLLAVLPAAAGMGVAGVLLNAMPLGITGSVDYYVGILRLPMAEAWIGLALLAVGGALAGLTLKRNRKADVL